jgi:hypothetical protein
MARTLGSKNRAAGDNHNAHDQYVKDLEDKLAIYEAKDVEVEVEDSPIPQTEYIKVMSLIPYRLNLCTKEKGQGKIYRFDSLYQVKRIIYSDMVDILEVNREFLEAGYFIILNPKLIRSHGLDDTYDKILTKEKIEQIWDGTDESIALFTIANKKQQDVIAEIVVDKLVHASGVIDLNLVDKLSRISGINIAQKAENAKALMNPVEEEKKATP